MFIGTAIIAVLLAVFGSSLQQQWTVFQLSRCGVSSVFFDPSGNVTWLALHKTTHHLAEIPAVCDCSHVESLDLSHSNIEDSIATVKEFPPLKLLDLSHSTLDDQSARHLVDVTATAVQASDTQLTAQGLAAMLDANHFFAIDVHNTVINRQEAEDLSEKYSVNIVCD